VHLSLEDVTYYPHISHTPRRQIIVSRAMITSCINNRRPRHIQITVSMGSPYAMNEAVSLQTPSPVLVSTLRLNSYAVARANPS
jgi:hypothetical protein